MADSRNSKYRQGSFLATKCVEKLCLDGNFSDWIVASHDCDIQAAYHKEPLLEVFPFRIVSKLDGNSRAKNARKLTLEAFLNDQSVVIELSAVDKISINKEEADQFDPHDAFALDNAGREIFQVWLAARYRRSSFSDAFITALNAGGKRFLDRIAALMDEYSEAVRSLLFKVDDDERNNAKEHPFRLGIYLLYSKRKESPEADIKGKECAERLDELFAQAFCSGESWQWVEVEYCDPVSDEAFTVADHEGYRQWSLEYLSHSGEREDALPFRGG